MDILIRKYHASKDYDALIKVIRSEGDEWKLYLIPQYKEALENSITYVAVQDNEICGYSRSMNDNDLFIWVIDLLVDKAYRGNSIGKKLMECVLKDYPEKEVLVLSDVDDYYSKLGYKKEGTIFKVQ